MNHQKPHEIQLAGMPVGVFGLKAAYHVQRQRSKMKDCPFDAGFDLYACRTEPKVESVGKHCLISVSTALHTMFSPGTFGMITERSSSFKKLNGGRVKVGIIDSGYTGEILVQVVCHEDEEYVVLEAIKTCADMELAIAQMIPHQSFVPVWQNVDVTRLPVTGRGSNGFGSTDQQIA